MQLQRILHPRRLTAGSPTAITHFGRKMIWTKPPWNYVPAVSLQGCTPFIHQGCIFKSPIHFLKQSHRWYQAGSKYWWLQGLAAWFRAKSTTLFIGCFSFQAFWTPMGWRSARSIRRSHAFAAFCRRHEQWNKPWLLRGFVGDEKLDCYMGIIS